MPAARSLPNRAAWPCMCHLRHSIMRGAYSASRMTRVAKPRLVQALFEKEGDKPLSIALLRSNLYDAIVVGASVWMQHSGLSSRDKWTSAGTRPGVW